MHDTSCSKQRGYHIVVQTKMTKSQIFLKQKRIWKKNIGIYIIRKQGLQQSNEYLIFYKLLIDLVDVKNIVMIHQWPYTLESKQL